MVKTCTQFHRYENDGISMLGVGCTTWPKAQDFRRHGVTVRRLRAATRRHTTCTNFDAGCRSSSTILKSILHAAKVIEACLSIGMYWTLVSEKRWFGTTSWEGNADKSCCKLSFRGAFKWDFIAHTPRDAAGCVNLAQDACPSECASLPAVSTGNSASPASTQGDSSKRIPWHVEQNEVCIRTVQDASLSSCV
jgi:hypothetical protein